MSLSQEIADAMHLLRDLVAKVRGVEEDLRHERALRLAHEITIRDQENQLAEKNATLERLQAERAQFWTKLLEDSDHPRDR